MVAGSYANFSHTPSTSSATYPGRPTSLLEALQQRPARSKRCVSDRIEPVACSVFHAYERGELLELEQKNS